MLYPFYNTERITNVSFGCTGRRWGMMQDFLPFYKLPYETRGEENTFVSQWFIK